MKESYFLLSLDFELMWGVTGTQTIEGYGENLKGVREAIPKLLALFEKYDIHATWAIVGFLFHKNKTALLRSLPKNIPAYHDSKHSTYQYIEKNKIGEDEYTDSYHWGYSLVQMIKNAPTQEVATHTYSHYFCLEEGQTVEQFDADIAMACAVARQQDITFHSIIFPRNQLNKEYLEVCEKYGIRYYRGPQQSKIWTPKSFDEAKHIRHKIVRMLDAYFNISGHCTYKLPDTNDSLINMPGSYLLRPYHKKLWYLEKLKLHRIKAAMTHAAKRGEIYHLWWHPHNFGKNTDLNIQMLEQILKHFSLLRKKYSFKSITMKELGEKITNGA